MPRLVDVLAPERFRLDVAEEVDWPTIMAQKERDSIQEAHHKNLADTMAHFRAVGHKLGDVTHTDPKRLPTGMMRSTFKHSSGPNKFKTSVRTAFNTEGEDHDKKIVTCPDEGDGGKDKEE